jgi:uncharacterized membrane protein
MQEDITRNQIHVIVQQQQVPTQTVTDVLQKQVYNNLPTWQKFISNLLLALGVGFTTAGIIFFFAYNWATIPNAVKLIMVQALVVVVTVFALWPKINVNYRKLLLTAAAILIGVMFAVFGQVYQTGANAYDFFLAWTLFTTLWAFAANYTPLWLLFVGLINTTIFLYGQQVTNWSLQLQWQIIFIVNALIATAFAIYKSGFKKQVLKNDVFTTVLVTAFFALTIANGFFIFDGVFSKDYLQILLAILLYTASFWVAIKNKNLVPIACMALSIIITMQCLFIQYSSSSASILFATIFAAGSVAATIFYLIKLHKSWANASQITN